MTGHHKGDNLGIPERNALRLKDRDRSSLRNLAVLLFSLGLLLLVISVLIGFIFGQTTIVGSVLSSFAYSIFSVLLIYFLLDKYIFEAHFDALVQRMTEAYLRPESLIEGSLSRKQTKEVAISSLQFLSGDRGFSESSIESALKYDGNKLTSDSIYHIEVASVSEMHLKLAIEISCFRQSVPSKLIFGAVAVAEFSARSDALKEGQEFTWQYMPASDSDRDILNSDFELDYVKVDGEKYEISERIHDEEHGEIIYEAVSPSTTTYDNRPYITYRFYVNQPRRLSAVSALTLHPTYKWNVRFDGTRIPTSFIFYFDYIGGLARLLPDPATIKEDRKSFDLRVEGWVLENSGIVFTWCDNDFLINK